MKSYFQSPVAFYTPSTICSAVNSRPEGNLRISSLPLTIIFTFEPPMSIISTLRSTRGCVGIRGCAGSIPRSQKIAEVSARDHPMKVATWNVNGIRARQEQVYGLDRREAGCRLPPGDESLAHEVPPQLLEWRYWLLPPARGTPARVSGAESLARAPEFLQLSAWKTGSDRRGRMHTVASIYVRRGRMPMRRAFLARAAASRGERMGRARPVLCGDLKSRIPWTAPARAAESHRAASRRARHAGWHSGRRAGGSGPRHGTGG